MHVSDSTTQVGQNHIAIGVLLVLGANTQPSEPMLHQSNEWPAPVRPVDRVGQADGYSSRITKVLGSLSDSSRPWNKNTSKHTTCKEEEPFSKPSKKTPNRSRTDQQQHNQKTHRPSKSPEANPTKGIHWSDQSHLGSSE
jgi:hypothetical protein